MNEDLDLNETLASEETNLENGEAILGEETKTEEESLGEAVIDAAETSGKKAKVAAKKTVDDEQNEKINELIGDLQRTRADFENFRRQAELQKEQHGNVVKFATINKVLPLIDDVERAIIANPDTLAPLQKSLEKAIKNVGLEKIESEPGTAFDPDLHDAVMVEGDGDEEVIAETLRTGYRYDGQVLRPTMVKVTKQ